MPSLPNPSQSALMRRGGKSAAKTAKEGEEEAIEAGGGEYRAKVANAENIVKKLRAYYQVSLSYQKMIQHNGCYFKSLHALMY